MIPHRFYSKIDKWLLILLIFLPINSIAVLVALYINDDPNTWSGWLSLGIVAFIYGGLLWPLYYELEKEGLLIRYGLVRKHIPYTDIIGVIPSRNILSSPALSIDRLHVETKDSFGALISPKNKELFLAKMAECAQHLELKDRALILKE